MAFCHAQLPHTHAHTHTHTHTHRMQALAHALLSALLCIYFVLSCGQVAHPSKSTPAAVPDYNKLGFESEAKHHFPLGEFKESSENVFITPAEHAPMDGETPPLTPLDATLILLFMNTSNPQTCTRTSHTHAHTHTHTQIHT
jgi:hypothetical protein